MPASRNEIPSGGSGTSNNILLAALQEMDAIIAESKLCLDNMSDSTATTASTPRQSGHGTSPEDLARIGSEKLSQSLELINLHNHGSMSGSLSRFSAISRSVPKINGYIDSPEDSSLILQLVEDLVSQIQSSYGVALSEAEGLSCDSRQVLERWLADTDNAENSTQANGGGSDHLSDAVKRLEADRSTLQRQLNILTDQVSYQTDKIHELQDLLLEKTCQLESTEALLREEMLTRSSLETRKLDLLSEVKDMRAQILAVEKEMMTKENIAPRIKETHLVENGSIRDCLDGDVKSSTTNDILRLRPEMEQNLQKAVENLTAKLDEKDRKIQQLEGLLKLHQNVNAITEDVSSSRNGVPHVKTDESRDGGRKPPYVSRQPVTHGSSFRRTYLVPSNNLTHSNSVGSDDSLTKYAESVPIAEGNGVSVTHSGLRRRESSSRSNQSRAPRSRSSDAKPARSNDIKRSTGSFRVHHLSPAKSIGERLSQLSVSSSWGFLRQRSSSNGTATAKDFPQEVNRCSSVPELGRLGSDSERFRCSTPKSCSSEDKKRGSLRRFFEKFTRSNSSTLNEIPPTPQTFKRGGIRATAGPRLQNTNGFRRKWDPTVPIKRWNQEQLVQWLENEVQIPLTAAGKNWIVNGEQFLRATPSELEKLGLYHPLHKKKLLLALKAADEQDSHPMGKLDYLWVLRWLEDVGLPQYKDVFADARVDGRMLNFLTTDDLFLLKITNALHHASMKRGIQVLRHAGYNPTSIRRRPIPSDSPLESPESVIFWSNHRVMEWLRFLDLSEYGPNLRGSGVHGGLLILEERFNPNVFAELLSIPQSKTLLRRHLSKSFTELVGSELIRQKRAAEAAPGFIPPSPHLKLKPVRRGFSLVRRKGKLEMDIVDYVCPIDLKIDMDMFSYKQEIPQSESSSSEEPKSLSSSSNQISLFSPTVLSLTV